MEELLYIYINYNPHPSQFLKIVQGLQPPGRFPNLLVDTMNIETILIHIFCKYLLNYNMIINYRILTWL